MFFEAIKNYYYNVNTFLLLAGFVYPGLALACFQRINSCSFKCSGKEKCQKQPKSIVAGKVKQKPKLKNNKTLFRKQGKNNQIE